MKMENYNLAESIEKFNLPEYKILICGHRDLLFAGRVKVGKSEKTVTRMIVGYIRS
jgi:hypothetical protein